jgi:hypothetical protein
MLIFNIMTCGKKGQISPFVMPGLVPGIHVFFLKGKTWMAGHRLAEATPSFRRLCPAMTVGR